MGFRSTTVYDAAGQVVSLVDAMNGLTQFQYDLAGNRTGLDANGEIWLRSLLGGTRTWPPLVKMGRDETSGLRESLACRALEGGRRPDRI